jgi:hypothetical protein
VLRFVTDRGRVTETEIESITLDGLASTGDAVTELTTRLHALADDIDVHQLLRGVTWEEHE